MTDLEYIAEELDALEKSLKIGALSLVMFLSSMTTIFTAAEMIW